MYDLDKVNTIALSFWIHIRYYYYYYYYHHHRHNYRWTKAGCSTNRLSIPGSGKRLFYSPEGPDLLWGPPSLLLSEFLGLTFILLLSP